MSRLLRLTRRRGCGAAAAILALTGGLSAAGAAAPAGTDAWQTYRNERDGYSVEYPADWAIDERVDAAGAGVTTFGSPGLPGGALARAVVVRAGGPAPPRLPHTRCSPVTVGGLPGTSCFDTVSRSAWTTLHERGTSYTVVAVGKYGDESVYQRLVESFRLLGPPAVEAAGPAHEEPVPADVGAGPPAPPEAPASGGPASPAAPALVLPDTADDSPGPALTRLTE